jgi:hypothetical protein
LWRDRLLVSLEPGAGALVRVARGLRPRIVAKQSFECDPAFGAEPWQGAVAALATAAEPLRRERLDVTVVLSNHFVRYAIVKPDASLAGAEERLGLARFQFGRIYGERARTWDVRLSEARRGAPCLASAVDAALVPAIAACFPKEASARLVSMQPYLMAAFNCWRGELPGGGAWLLLVEPERACLALAASGNWFSVHTLRGAYPGAEDWAALLDRQRLRTEVESAPREVRIHAPAAGKLAAREAHGWNLLGLAPPSLEGFVPREDARFAMALTAR